MKIRYLLTAVAILLCITAAAGCTGTSSGQTNQIVGTYEYSADIKYLGDQGDKLYTLYYRFFPEGEGRQYWVSPDDGDVHILPIKWDTAGAGLYKVSMTNPDGAIYQETLKLEDGLLTSITDKRYRGYYSRTADVTARDLLP